MAIWAETLDRLIPALGTETNKILNFTFFFFWNFLKIKIFVSKIETYSMRAHSNHGYTVISQVNIILISVFLIQFFIFKRLLK